MDDDGSHYYQAPRCDEPCAYEEYKYSLSNSEYPAVNYWDKTLSKIIAHYDTYKNAKLNLVKLVFFTEQMKVTTSVQTADYEIQNFIGKIQNFIYCILHPYHSLRSVGS